jgi:hypothetical protein
MDRYARCKSLEAAWELADFLTANMQNCRFEVHMPSRTEFDVHTAVGYPLPKVWQEHVRKLVAAYKAAKLKQMAEDSQGLNSTQG